MIGQKCTAPVLNRSVSIRIVPHPTKNRRSRGGKAVYCEPDIMHKIRFRLRYLL